MSPKPIVLNAFNVMTPSQIGAGLWRHPEDRRYRFNDVDWWIDYARRIEAASFTALVFADGFGTTDVSPLLDQWQIEEGVYFPASDPFVYAPAIAAHTTTLSLVVTASTTFENPYGLARRFTAFDHLAKGRVGWNVVTSFMPAMARAYGTGELPDHTARYGRADEFLNVAYKLWEGSWEDGASVREPDRLVDAARVHEVSHQGPNFTVSGRYSIAPSPQRTPVLFQAGHSAEGQDFAARHAEVVLVGGSPEYARAHIRAVREKAEAWGRDPANIKFIAPILIVAAEDDASAQKRLDLHKSFWSQNASLASVALYSGYDLTTQDPDDVFVYRTTERHRAASGALRAAGAAGKKVRDVVADATAFAGGNRVIVGGPETVADELEYWVDDVGVAGFNIMELVSPADIDRFIEHVVPVLRARGRLDDRKEALTFRERLFPEHGHRLAADHPGRRFAI